VHLKYILVETSDASVLDGIWRAKHYGNYHTKLITDYAGSIVTLMLLSWHK